MYHSDPEACKWKTGTMTTVVDNIVKDGLADITIDGGQNFASNNEFKTAFENGSRLRGIQAMQ